MSQSSETSPASPGPAAFRFERWLCGPVTVVSMIGSFDRPAVGQVYPVLVQALVARLPPYLVLDLRRLTELTLCGCLMLLLAERHAKEASGRMIAVCDKERLAWAPALARAATIEQALAELAARDRDYRLSVLHRRKDRAAPAARPGGIILPRGPRTWPSAPRPPEQEP